VIGWNSESQAETLFRLGQLHFIPPEAVKAQTMAVAAIVEHAKPAQVIESTASIKNRSFDEKM
jgi:hypothetical protein